MPTDPICGMEGDESTPLRADRDGQTYYFCSEHCRESFLRQQAAASQAGAETGRRRRQPEPDDAPYVCPMHPEVEQRQPGGLLAVADPIKEDGRVGRAIARPTDKAKWWVCAYGLTHPTRLAATRVFTSRAPSFMLTGDNERTARAVAKRLDIDHLEAQIKPQQKHERIRTLRQQGGVVAMAGDGINDAPALAEADVGIAMGTGTDVAIESADVTLVKGDLLGIVKAFRLSRVVMRNIRQNLFFALVYNSLGVPIAAGVLVPLFGLSALLSPMIAAAAMSFSSVSVVGNALRLRAVSLRK